VHVAQVSGEHRQISRVGVPPVDVLEAEIESGGSAQLRQYKRVPEISEPPVVLLSPRPGAVIRIALHELPGHGAAAAGARMADR
jgi:hypothetical protein